MASPSTATPSTTEYLYWAWLSHFGTLLSNNSFGHRMVRVQQEVLPGGVQPARGTKSAASWRCTTTPATCSLCCGSTRPSRAARASTRAARPRTTTRSCRADILPILYRGFPHHRRSEQPDDQPDVTPYDVPIFSNVDGRICINFTYSSILPALHELGRELTPEETEALEILREVLVRQQLELRMQPGDAAMANNYGMCHSRLTSSTVPTRPAGACCCARDGGADRGPPPRSVASSSTWRTRVADWATTSAGPGGPHRDQRLRQRRRGPRQPLQGGAGQAQARLDPVRPRLVYFDQWTDPVAGEVLAEHGGIDVTCLSITSAVDELGGPAARHGYQS